MRLTFLSSADKILLMNKTAEGGFVFLELAIGLPLIFMLLWTMSNLFVDTWQNCRNLIADFTLQMEVQTVMQRIVDELRTARAAEKLKNIAARPARLAIHKNFLVFHTNQNSWEIVESKNSTVNDTRSVYYFRESVSDNDSDCCYIYRQRRAYEAKSEPLTGKDDLSLTDIKQFQFESSDDKKLWRIMIRARSNVSGHEFTLKTTVFLEGAG